MPTRLVRTMLIAVPGCKICDQVPYAEVDGGDSAIELMELASGVNDNPAMIRMSIQGGPWMKRSRAQLSWSGA